LGHMKCTCADPQRDGAAYPSGGPWHAPHNKEPRTLQSSRNKKASILMIISALHKPVLK